MGISKRSFISSKISSNSALKSSGSSNSNTRVYGSTSGYLGNLNTRTNSSGRVYGSSTSYTTSYDGGAAYAASQNEQAKLNAFVAASEENKRRWNEEYLRNNTMTPKASVSGLLNIKYYKAVRIDLIVTTNGYDYVFEWDPNEAEN